jgi:hypothetical protein
MQVIEDMEVMEVMEVMHHPIYFVIPKCSTTHKASYMALQN